MESLYVITINWAGSPDTAKIEAVLPGRWMRFSATTWLMWSAQDVQQIFEAIAPKLTAKDTELIMRIDEAHWWGFAYPWVAAWIKSRGHSTT
jgi:hypothetical protein